MQALGNKSAMALVQEYVEPYIQRIFKTAAAFIGLFGAYKVVGKLIPGSHRLSKLKIREKTVLITGASTGLGRALAFEFYSRGAKLILAARSLDKLEQLCAELEKTGREKGWNNPNRPDFGYLDLNNGTSPSIEKQIETLIRGPRTKIDVLVNNAGVSNRGSCLETSLDVQRQVMEVNFFGHVAVTRALLNNVPDGGAILVISSVQGRLPCPYRSAYCAGKHALDAFFSSLRAEERFGRLQVLVVSAGYMNTQFGTRALDPNGRPVGYEDENQKKGMAPEKAALKIVEALVDRKSELLLASFSAKAALYARFLAPNLLCWLLYRRAQNELKNKAK